MPPRMGVPRILTDFVLFAVRVNSFREERFESFERRIVMLLFRHQQVFGVSQHNYIKESCAAKTRNL